MTKAWKEQMNSTLKHLLKDFKHYLNITLYTT